jgi:pyridoxamine 5'-phosphate oxidase
MAGARLETLDAIEAALWHELLAAPHDRGHPWRTPVLATTDGEIADARTVILRDVDRDKAALLIYTDARAAKVAQIARHPLGTLVAWSPALGWQLRARVHMDVSNDGLEVTSRWASLKATHAAQDYLSLLAPGSALDGSIAQHGDRAYFALIEARVLSIDWLELHEQGHRRARFGDNQPPRWLQP